MGAGDRRFERIGAAIARELATLGIDLVLTARRRDALDAVAATCKGVKVEIVTADLGQPDAAHALWSAATAGGPIDILQQRGVRYFRRFDEVDWARDAELIQLLISNHVIDVPDEDACRPQDAASVADGRIRLTVPVVADAPPPSLSASTQSQAASGT